MVFQKQNLGKKMLVALSTAFQYESAKQVRVIFTKSVFCELQEVFKQINENLGKIFKNRQFNQKDKK